MLARVVGFARSVVFAQTVGNDVPGPPRTPPRNQVPNIVFEIVAGGALAEHGRPGAGRAAERGSTGSTARPDRLGAADLDPCVLLVPLTLVAVVCSPAR